ncbi:type II toxin-antitoxin system VapB family antitoxin [Falsiroseomonas sp.]|jgi:antitoxin VapB|uniref:type II toxin-antitoxin system VapB family antitoxin n=1 Tax=Falsiroseomonas sp. TaxID=2870721 RepID=UPI0035669A73
MGQLNIKSDRAEELASRLAALTGESKTQVVITALEEKLARMQAERQAKIEALKALGARVRAATPPHLRTSDHSDLYDEDGLPR